MNDSKPWWRPWRLCREHQWVDRHGQTWLTDDSGKWWRNGLTIRERFTFQPIRRPPKEFGPYRRARVKISAQGITWRTA